MIWKKNIEDPIQRIPVDKPVVSLDASSTSIVTGIRETGIMVFGKNDVGFSSKYVYPMEDIVWTVVINPDERYESQKKQSEIDVNQI